MAQKMLHWPRHSPHNFHKCQCRQGYHWEVIKRLIDGKADVAGCQVVPLRTRRTRSQEPRNRSLMQKASKRSSKHSECIHNLECSSFQFYRLRKKCKGLVLSRSCSWWDIQLAHQKSDKKETLRVVQLIPCQPLRHEHVKGCVQKPPMVPHPVRHIARS